MRISYIKGDATRPHGDGVKIIAHICNDIGAWGAGFVMALSSRWKLPEQAYRKAKGKLPKNARLPGGTVQFVSVEPEIIVANMIAQSGVRCGEDPPIRYRWLSDCLMLINDKVLELGGVATVHMPRIGTGLAGGDWAIIGPMIEELIFFPVFVYDLPKRIA